MAIDKVVKKTFLKAVKLDAGKGITRSKSQDLAGKTKAETDQKDINTPASFEYLLQDAIDQIASSNAAQADYSDSIGKDLPDRDRVTGDVSGDSEAQSVALKQRIQDIRKDPKMMASMKADFKSQGGGLGTVMNSLKSKIRQVEKGYIKPDAGREKQR